MKCPNKTCRNFGNGMDNVASLARDFVNHICGFCHCHYYGDPENPKFYTKQEWDKWIMEGFKQDSPKAFGLWKDRQVDGVDYQRALRKENEDHT